MTWARLDDAFHSHPRTLAAGLEANGLFARALSYSAHYLTDGLVPTAWAEAQGGRRPVRKLLDVGVLEAVDGGYRIRDFLDYNPSRADVEEQRERERAKKGNQRGHPRGSPRGSPQGTTQGTTQGTPGETPEAPIPIPIEGEVSPSTPLSGDAPDDRVTTADVLAVFDAWRESTGKRTAKLDDKRRRVIRKALADGWPLSDLIDAVRGWRHSPHHRGENERHTVYTALPLLLRDAEQIEKFRDLERRHRNGGDPRSLDEINARLNQRATVEAT